MADIFQKAFSEQISRIIEKYENIDDSFDEIIDVMSGDSEEKQISSEDEEEEELILFDIFHINKRKHDIKFKGFDFMNNRLGFIRIYENIFSDDDEFNTIYRRMIKNN